MGFTKRKIEQCVSGDYVSLDFETTGLSPKRDRVIEIGAVKHKADGTTEIFNTLVNPETIIKWVIIDITKITNKMLKDAPVAADVFPQLLDFIGDNVIIAHSYSFEKNFLREELSRLDVEKEFKFICSMMLSRRIFQGLESYKLVEVCDSLNIETGDLHRALPDAHASSEVYLGAVNEILSRSGKKNLSHDYVTKLCKLPKEKVEDFLLDGEV